MLFSSRREEPILMRAPMTRIFSIDRSHDTHAPTSDRASHPRRFAARRRATSRRASLVRHARWTT